MIDLYLFNTVMNTIWYVFTILFVLYRFTSFFSYIYNFLRFCANLWSWITWGWNEIVAFIRRKQGYVRLDPENPQDTEHLLPGRNQSNSQSTWWSRFRQVSVNMYQRAYTWIFGRPHPRNRPQTTDIPLYESEYFGQGDETNKSGNSQTLTNKTQEERYFDHQLSQLCSESTFSFGPPRSTTDSYYSPFIPTSSLPFAVSNSQNTHDKLDEQYDRKPGKSVSVSEYQSIALFTPDNDGSNSEKPLDISLHNPLLSSSIFHPIPLDPPQTVNNVDDSNIFFNSDFIKRTLNPTLSKSSSVQAVSNVTAQVKSLNGGQHLQEYQHSDDETTTHTTVDPIEIAKPTQPPKRLKNISQSYVAKKPMHPLSDSFDEELERNPYI